MSIYIHKSHNVSVLLYHLVCVAKGRRVIFDPAIDQKFKEVCLEFAKRFEIHFLEIGTDNDHIHFLIQSVPMYSPTKIVRTVKSVTAKKMFEAVPSLKQDLWGGEFWSDGYFINTVGRNGSENAIKQYVKNQGKDRNYIQLHKDQLKLFV